jgi:hypothetical protein
MTPAQVEEKLKMWRRQWRRGKPKWYVEKGLNITYEKSLSTGATTAVREEITEVAKVSRFRTAGRFVGRELPGLMLQVVFAFLFPPGVHVHNDRIDELSRMKIDPAVQDALTKQEPVIDQLLHDDPEKSVYANVTIKMDYQVAANDSGDLELYLKDITFIDTRITNQYVTSIPEKFLQTGSLQVTKQVTYSLLLYEPESVTRAREQQEAAQAEEDLQRPGMGAGSRAGARAP